MDHQTSAHLLEYNSNVCSHCKNPHEITAKCSRFHFICVDCQKVFKKHCPLCREILVEPRHLSLEDLLHPPVIPYYYPPCSSTDIPLPIVSVPTSKRVSSKEISFYETCTRNLFVIMWDSLALRVLKFGKKMRKQNKASTAMIITGLLAKLGKSLGKPLYKDLKKKCGQSGALKLGLLLAILVIGTHALLKDSE